MDRLSPLDAAFLHIEGDVNHMHIGSVAQFEGPMPPRDALRAMVRSKLPALVRYRQRIRSIPLELARPVWVDDPHFHLDYHVRFTALPTPGGRAELAALVSRVMSQQLDRAKPLWELWFVEGIDDGRWGMISKIHHAMVDGVAGTDLLTRLLDDDPAAEAPPQQPWAPAPPVSTTRLLGEAAVDAARSPMVAIRAAGRTARHPLRTARTVLTDARGATRFEGLAHPGPATTLVGPIGPHRRYAWASSTIAVAQRIRGVHGGTINDVVLTAITGGFRQLFAAHAEDPAQHPLRSLVPVSVRAEDEQGIPNNRVAALLADLPVHLEDPLDRLAEIRRQLAERKQSHMAEASDALVQLGDLTPASLLSVGLRVGFAGAHLLGRTSVHTVTTNVPGPRQPLYAVGRRMLTATPYVPIASPIRVGVAIFSYQGLLTFGITGDQSSVADVDVLAEGIEADLATLVALSPAQDEST